MKRKRKAQIVRNYNVFFTNDRIGDGRFVPELVKALRELADKLESGEADSLIFKFTTLAGTDVVALAGTYSAATGLPLFPSPALPPELL